MKKKPITTIKGCMEEMTSRESTESAIKELVVFHTKRALKYASENATAHVSSNGEWVSSDVEARVSKNSILESYPESLIV